MTRQNIFSQIPTSIHEEVFETIIHANNLTIERIISKGQASPPGFWYNQDRNEWVMVVQGKARLKFEKGDEMMKMESGDYVHIPAHCRHRVDWTDPAQETIWLAVHYS